MKEVTNYPLSQSVVRDQRVDSWKCFVIGKFDGLTHGDRVEYWPPANGVKFSWPRQVCFIYFNKRDEVPLGGWF